MKKKHFTLVEILVTISIIIILAGILIPVVTSAMEKAEITKARAGITNLANAIKQYESTYGKLPLPKKNYSSEAVLDENQYKWLILLLQGETISDSENSSWKDYGESKAMNARKMSFLSVEGDEPGTYTDTWDNKYQVVLDADYDSKVPGKKICGLIKEDNIHYSVVIWSKGPDGNENSTTASDKSNKDNIYSFSTTWDSGHTIVK